LNKKKVPVVSIILYVLAGLLLATSLYMAIYFTSSIVSYAKQGYPLAGQWTEIIDSFRSLVNPELFYAVVVFGLGWIIQLMTQSKEFDVEIEEFELDSEDVMDEDDMLEEVEE
jgi:hypothetical protein